MRKPFMLTAATILMVTLLIVPVSLAQNATSSASTANPSAGSVVITAPPAPAVQKGTPMESGEVIVKFKQNVVGASVAESAIHKQVGATVVNTSAVIPGLQLVKLPAGASVDAAIAQYKSNPAVEDAAPNGKYTVADTTPNDPGYASSEWGLKNTGQTIQGVTGTPGADINAPAAWDTTTGSSSIIVAVADTGVQVDHPDLAANVGPGWDFIYNVSDPTPLSWDGSFHGTHVAGTIGAVTNNSIGVAGVDWHVQLMPLQIFDSTGVTNDYLINNAIVWAEQHGASIINLSLGGPGANSILKTTIEQSSLLFVCAAGNGNKTTHIGYNTDLTPEYPASYGSPNIIAVAASDNRDKLASWSNYGNTSVDLAAPGVFIESTYYQYDHGYGYLWANGTSMAAPHVSGVAALVKAVHPDYGYAQLKSAILGATDAKSAFTGKMVTGGRLDAAKAVGGSKPSLWHTETVDSSWGSYGVGMYTSLQLTPTGGPAISYYDSTNGALKYTYKSSTGWHTQTVDSVGVGTTDHTTSLALTPTGWPAISYYDATTQSLKYTYKSSTGWHTETVDSGGVGSYNSLQLTPTGWPAISYDDAHGALKYTYKSSTGWHTQTVDSSSRGFYTSLQLSTSGWPAISYRDTNNNVIKYAYKSPTGWHTETVGGAGESWGPYTSLKLTPSGWPAISYWDWNVALNYTYKSPTGWHTESIDSSSKNAGEYASLQLTSAGWPAISFFDVYNHNLKYTYKNAGGWHTATVDSSDTHTVGEFTSLKLTPTGWPAISYYSTGGELKYAYKSAS